MKITILQGAFLPIPPKQGGAVEKMWYALGKKFVEKGHEVYYISKRYNSFLTNEVLDGVKHLRIKGYPTPSNLLKLKLLDLFYTIRSRKVIPEDSDVIVTHTFWAPIILKAIQKRKTIVDVQRMPKRQMKFYTKALALRANSTIVAENIRSEISSKFHDKVFMVPNPLPFEEQESVNFEEKKDKILYVGRIHPEKGVHLLIESFEKMQTDWSLEIVGPWEVDAGGGGDEYFSLLKKLSSQSKNNIRFRGPVFDTDELNKNYKESRIFIYPSLAEKGETFGLAPLEAMSFGSVPIVSDLTCFKDFITAGQNGLIFDHNSEKVVELLQNKIETLITDQERRNKLARKALDVRQTHSVDRIADQFLYQFESLLRTTS